MAQRASGAEVRISDVLMSIPDDRTESLIGGANPATHDSSDATTHRLDSAHDGELDRIHQALTSATDTVSVAAAMDQLIWTLHRVRQSMEAATWESFIERCRNHSLLPIVHEDPFTRRAFEKPRGYAGDAVMLDYIYSLEERIAPPPMSALGQRIFQYTSQAPSSRGVRARRAEVARQLDTLAERKRRARVLAIASGHLREADLCASIRRRSFGEFIALDTDAESVEFVNDQFGRFGTRSVKADAISLIRGRLDLGEFDLIYSTGLYDYLPARTAQRLTTRLFSMLTRGGRLLLANFVPGIRDDGYMEAYMDWRLIYRDRQDMLRLTQRIEESDLQQVRLFTEDDLNIVFLQLDRRI